MLFANYYRLTQRAVPPREAESQGPRNGSSDWPVPSDDDLQGAADALLAAIDPDLPENDYFPTFARERIRWMAGEHGKGQLTVGFLLDEAGARLPSGVLTAALRSDDESTILIAKRRFKAFLEETGGFIAPPATQQQKNDFAVAIVHEIVHLWRSTAQPQNSVDRIREESEVWHEVTLGLVRPLRALHQPVNRRFIAVDEAFQRCRDHLPCPDVLSQLNRTP